MAAGYLAGTPVMYGSAAQPDALAAAMEAYRAANADNLDAELATQASLYGVGVELLYFNERARVRFATMDPTRAFVAYDDTVAHRPLIGLHWRARMNEAGTRVGVALTAYTSTRIFEFEGASLRSLTLTGERSHYFGGVPMIEYWNDAQERGDVEPVLSLLDAYDTLQSDRLNDKQEFADSLLVFTGVSEIAPADDPNDDRPVSRRLREDKALSLPDREAKVEWLTKQLNESDTQVLANALRTDIHKLAMIPDLSDERFAGNVSGVAMRFKLLGLEQLVMIKERYFREGLRSRLRLVSRAMEMIDGTPLDADQVDITFSRTLPLAERVETSEPIG
jgi:SPP1 family phage portal protein